MAEEAGPLFFCACPMISPLLAIDFLGLWPVYSDEMEYKLRWGARLLCRLFPRTCL